MGMAAAIGALSTLDSLRCVVREMRSHEDIVLLPLLLGASNGAPGTFVELGAYDGISGSQSYLMERCFGWHGLLIEASPHNFALLDETPRASQTHKMHSAVCATRGNVTMFTSGGTVAGVAEDMTKMYKQRMHRKHWGNCKNGQCKADVPCAPLPELMADAGFARTTFLSLDVEGGEERVLQSVRRSPGPGASFPFDVIMVEMDRTNPQKDQRVREMLIASGMRKLPLTQYTGSVNELFAQPHVADPRPPLDKEADAVAKSVLKDGWFKPAMRKMPTSPYLAELMNITSTSLIVKWLMASMPVAFEQLKKAELAG